MPAWRDHGRYDRPFGISSIARVTKATAVRRKAVFRLMGTLQRIKHPSMNHIRFIGLKNFPDRLALDLRVDLPRARERGSVEVAKLEGEILRHLFRNAHAGDDA